MSISTSLLTDTFLIDKDFSLSTEPTHWSQSYIKANSQLEILSKYYTKQDPSNNTNQFFRKIDKSNLNFFTLSSKFLKVKKELDNLNDCLISNLFRQIGDFIKEIERLNIKLTDNTEFTKQIREANLRESNLIKEITLSKGQIRLLEKRISEQTLIENKLKQEIFDYKRQLQFCQDKLKLEIQNNTLFQNDNKVIMNRTTNNSPTNGMHNKLKERYTDRKQNKTLLQKLDLDISNDNDDKINNNTTCMLTEVEVNDNEMFQTEMNTERGMNNKKKNQRKYNSKCNKSVNITQNKIVNNIVVNTQSGNKGSQGSYRKRSVDYTSINNNNSNNSKELMNSEGGCVLTKEDVTKHKNELKVLKNKINNEVENEMEMLKNQEKEIQKILNLLLE
jgi:hypothetical protein